MMLTKHVGSWSVVGEKRGVWGAMVVPTDEGSSAETPNIFQVLRDENKHDEVALTRSSPNDDVALTRCSSTDDKKTHGEQPKIKERSWEEVSEELDIDEAVKFINSTRKRKDRKQNGKENWK